MNRHKNFPALTLSMRSFGESNREAFFLTPQDGIVKAAVFGGPKSKLRAYVSPFQSGTLYLYSDSAKNTNKVTDFDVAAWRPELREMLERGLTATYISAALLAGCGGGVESSAAFDLANDCLDALKTADDSLCEAVYVYFLWNWLDVLGFRPEGGAEKAVYAGVRFPADVIRHFKETAALKAKELYSFTPPSRASLSAAKKILRGLLHEASGSRVFLREV
ncbi:MAG: recombination protein O N-terminal domain-containing protein [Spirochaetaceae bacterium]|jgi:DNA repair protein RecO (recombination protein O)|nr:recombination protein O N-terminal domain-containing protein [Spirochaetaceae bacterium]